MPLRRLRAVEPMRPMTRGTKLPHLFHCVDEADEGVDVVLKFGFELYRREFSLVAEAVAAQLAPDLGLTVRGRIYRRAAGAGHCT